MSEIPSAAHTQLCRELSVMLQVKDPFYRRIVTRPFYSGYLLSKFPGYSYDEFRQQRDAFVEFMEKATVATPIDVIVQLWF